MEGGGGRGSEAAEKNPLNDILFLKQFGYCSGISFAFLYLKATSGQNTA